MQGDGITNLFRLGPMTRVIWKYSDHQYHGRVAQEVKQAAAQAFVG